MIRLQSKNLHLRLELRLHLELQLHLDCDYKITPLRLQFNCTKFIISMLIPYLFQMHCLSIFTLMFMFHDVHETLMFMFHNHLLMKKRHYSPHS